MPSRGLHSMPPPWFPFAKSVQSIFTHHLFWHPNSTEILLILLFFNTHVRSSNIVYQVFICLLTSFHLSITTHTTLFNVWLYGPISIIPLQDMYNKTRFTLLSMVIHIQYSLVYALMNQLEYNVFRVIRNDLITSFNVIIVVDTGNTTLYLPW